MPQARTSAQLDAHPAFERWWARAQTLVEGLLLVAIIVGLCGGFGDGWLARTSTLIPGTQVTLFYDRLARNSVDSRLAFRIPPTPAASTATIRLDGQFMRRIQLKRITPQPTEQSVADGGAVFRFALGPSPNGDVLAFLFTPERSGLLSFAISYGDFNAKISQFVYP